MEKNKIERGVNTTVGPQKEVDESENIFLPTQFLSFTDTTGNILKLPENMDQTSEKLSLKTNQLAACMKKLHECKQRQSELLTVMVLMQKQGVDVEKIYEGVISGKLSASEEES